MSDISQGLRGVEDVLNTLEAQVTNDEIDAYIDMEKEDNRPENWGEGFDSVSIGIPQFTSL